MADIEPSVDARPALEEERATLRAHIEELGVATYDENFADSAQVAAEQGENRALVDTLKETLKDVEHALERLDAGTYGQCEGCGQPIGDDRLEAMPASRLCFSCASGH